MLCYGGRDEHPKAAAVSISADNLRDNLWSELNKWLQRSELLQASFHYTQTRIFAKDHPNTWFISARSFAKTANAEEIGRTLSGLHSKFVLYVIDESGDIPPSIVKAAEQGLSTGPTFGKIVQAGNPTSQSGMLYAAASTLAHEWFNIQITGDPDDPRRSNRIDPIWAREQIENYGRTNPWVMAFILGLFPESAINTLLSPDEVELAMRRNVHESTYSFAQKRLGIDVARFGIDSTIIFPRQGLQAFECAQMRNARTHEIAARVAQAKINWGAELEFVDGTGGFGSGVVDSLIQGGHTPHEIHFSGESPEVQYVNMRAYMWFKMAEWVKRGGALPNDPILKKELTAPTYFFKKGKFQIEDKEQIKSRLGFSPDRADALALTFAHPDMPGQEHLPPGFKKPRVKSEYDPFNR